MARLDLKLENVVLREYEVSGTPLTIGRLPDNAIQIDHFSVSGHHARIVAEGANFVLYDQDSTNGTYVNGQKVSRAVLVNGDTVHVGRHILSFSDEPQPAFAPGSAVSSMPTRAEPPPIFGASNGKPLGVLVVVSGKTDQNEYVLTAAETVIGRSDTANIRLLRWFAPKVATIIYRREGKYFIVESPNPNAVRVNSEVVFGERELAPGDTILVDEISFTFNLQS
jgi:pSer/pThr/pTyr-binding forkhead associated (FHA) protein